LKIDKEVLVLNINEVLEKFHASNRGSYIILECPYCLKKEAFCYIDDIKKWEVDHSHKIRIRCNRLNKCGKISYLNDFIDNDEFNDKDMTIKERNPIRMSKKGIEFLQTFTSYFMRQNNIDINIRGISKEVLKNNGIIYYPKKFESIIDADKLSDYYGNKYRSANYKNRDIIIPIVNKYGDIERLLLRSLNYKDEDYKKEIQVMLKRNGVEIWNLKDLYNDDKKIIFISEGVYDALSILEVVNIQDVGAIALPGVKKYKQLLTIIKEDEIIDKTFIFAFDNDEAGKKYSKNAYEDFIKENLNIKTLNLDEYKDCNDFLINDRELFQKRVNHIIEK
jgi:DNA primase